MDDSTANTMMMLDACEDVEKVGADIYHFLADHFHENAPIARLWRKTALEEENHARQVMLAKKMMKNIVWISTDTWRKIFSAQVQIHGIFDRIQESAPSLKEALLFAIDMEAKMDFIHMQNSILMEDKAGNDLFVAMMKADQGHAARLKEALVEVQAHSGEF